MYEWKSLIQYCIEEFLEVEPEEVEVVWVKNQHSFCEHIEKNGLPDFICFDNDLGIGYGSGYDCAKYIVDYCLDHGTKLPGWYIQSANPVAKEYIDSLLENFKNSQNNG